METKEIKINVPEGYEIDEKNSTFECIKFKKKEIKRFRDNIEIKINGYFIDVKSNIDDYYGNNKPSNYNLFATEKQAKSALAMAQISQIMANDERFGGVVTDEEWKSEEFKYIIYRYNNNIDYLDRTRHAYEFLAFHTKEQRDLFVQENEDLVKQYLMID